MKTWIVLLRGINVGGHNKLPMAALKDDLSALGYDNVRTYIQSGNVVLDEDGETRDIADRIAQSIHENHGFTPQVMVLSVEGFVAAAKANPYPVTPETGNLLHLFFMDTPPPKPDLDRIAALAADSEEWHLEGPVFYLYAPDGVARSKLMAGAEKALGVPTTARNWRTVLKLLEMIKS